MGNVHIKTASTFNGVPHLLRIVDLIVIMMLYAAFCDTQIYKSVAIVKSSEHNMVANV